MLRKLAVIIGIAGLSSGPFALAADPEPVSGLGDAIVAGTPHLLFRYRYEFVDDDNFSNDANASTLRLRLNYKTGDWRDWSGFTELDYIAHVLQKDFDSGGATSSGMSAYPIVADPKGADLNQFYLDYGGFADTRLRFGRQRILLDKHRFVGNVGWRQNGQTYDGVSVTYNGLANTELFYSYVSQVNRIFGERSNVGQDDSNTHLFRGQISLNGDWKLIPYFYSIDSDDFAAFSTTTLGTRIEGRLSLGNGSLDLMGEVATQSDAADNPANYDAQYFHFAANWTAETGLSLGLGFESLGGDQNTAGEAFRTPLATLHAFQGWADQFLGTATGAPAAGVGDFYINAKYKIQQWSLQAVYHDFSAADGPARWGSEVDLSAGRKLGDRYSVLLKAALFREDNAAFRDVSKLWLQFTANY